MTCPARQILRCGFTAYLLAALLVLLGLTLWKDPLRLLPSNSHLLLWLDACPANNVRFACNVNQVGHYKLYGYVDLHNGNLGVEADPDNNGASSAVRVPKSIYSGPINSAQEEEIKHVIKTMPAQKVTLLEGYDFNRNIYFSFWKDNRLQTYVYAKNDLPEEVAGLLKGFKVNLNVAIN